MRKSRPRKIKPTLRPLSRLQKKQKHPLRMVLKHPLRMVLKQKLSKFTLKIFERVTLYL